MRAGIFEDQPGTLEEGLGHGPRHAADAPSGMPFEYALRQGGAQRAFSELSGVNSEIEVSEYWKTSGDTVTWADHALPYAS